MLDRLFVRNFQSHDESLIELVSGINAIVGEPNSGKTALLRAFQWAVTNRPLGDSFIRRGQDEARVQIVFTKDNQITAVTRVRGKSVSTYTLVTNSGEAEFTAFGNTPPLEVTEALNLSDLNYQAQLAPYFLVFDSPGAIAGYIRAATGLEDVKGVIDALARRHRATAAVVRDRTADLEGVEKRLQDVSRIDTDRLESLIGQADTIEADTVKYGQEILSLVGVVGQLQKVQSEQVVLPEDELTRISSDISTWSAKYNETIAQLGRLTPVIVTLVPLMTQRISLPESRLQQIAFDFQEVYSHYSQLVATKEKLVSTVAELNTNYQQTVTLPDNLDDLLGWKTKAEAQYSALTTQTADLHGIMVDLASIQEASVANEIQQVGVELQALRAQLTTCPTCGSELTEEAKHKLLESV